MTIATTRIIHDEQTTRGRLVVTAMLDRTAMLKVELNGRLVGLGGIGQPASAGAEVSVGQVDFVGERGLAVKAARDAYVAEYAAEIDQVRVQIRAKSAVAQADRPSRPSPGVTGAEADIEANYPGGLAAFRRDEPADRTPRHKGEVEGY